ncbi:hypothetical protein ACQ5SO_03615 [Rhodovulum sp. DZ06]|uniref:hypothetical protein n=1 Tax=Rhodovulum sp. DZ06 TaxID=3425126 RepID=UPI003D35498F
MTFSASNGADTSGGTFRADDVLLESFTLWVYGAAFRAIVATSDGTDIGTVLWESGDVTGTASVAEYGFTPGIALTPGQYYFIGLDSGWRTGVAGSGAYGVYMTDGGIDGMHVHEYNAGILSGSDAAYDIATTIVMTDGLSDVPLPAAAPLLLLGLGGLAALGRARGA